MSTITLGYSIQGGLQVDIGKTLTLGYGYGVIKTPLIRLILNGTITRELLMTGTITIRLDCNGTITRKLEL